MSLFAPFSSPSEAQVKALADCKVLTSRRNLIVSAPTNSGKSLIGYLVLLEAVARGRRALLLEPLRAIAQEKFDELTQLLPELSAALGRKIGLVITTGDYRLENETMHSAPPEGGELVIATPERIEAILRNPDFDAWIDSFGAVCADEAHLLSSTHRGPSLEFVLTNFLLAKAPPRILLLSATLGDARRALDWLAPCDLIRSIVRRPPLTRSILQLEPEESADETIVTLAAQILAEKNHSLLIFTYQTSSTNKVAAMLSEKAGNVCGEAGALAYHAKMTRAMRTEARAAYVNGRCRCLVSTTALAAGVNLPATHLIIRDLTFYGVGPIPLDQLIQMCGRAGRGSNPGHAFLIHRPGDIWDISELAEGLRSQRMPDLVSAMVPQSRSTDQIHRSSANRDNATEPTAEFLLAILARSRESGMTLDQVHRFVSASLAGRDLLPHLDEALHWLSDPSRLLAYRRDDGRLIPTSLGLAAARSSLPLPIAASVAQLIRDLLSLGAEESVLHAWCELDHLLILELLADRTWSLRPFSVELATKVDDWMERSAHKSILYAQWIRGAQAHSKASELLGSIGLSADKKPDDPEEWCRRRAYAATFRACILWLRSGGDSPQNLSRVWDIDDISGLEEGWRDNRLWLLGALAEIFDVKCFYYHLRTDCGAGDERVKRAKRCLQRMRIVALQTATRIKLCSPLGPLLVQMRDGRGLAPGVGPKTIEKLEAMGIQSLSEIVRMTHEDFKKVGVSAPIAKRLQAYIRRRLA